jgi:hypothetical protein
MTELSKLPPGERAKRYRELAREARRKAANSKREAQTAFMKFGEQWEQLALEAEADAEDDTTDLGLGPAVPNPT